jgi:two-component system, NarL family, nitrate/nitrite response regulator NarL
MVQRNERMRPDSEEKSIRRKAMVVGPQRLYRDVLASFLSATGLAVVAEGSDMAGVWKAIDLKAQPELLVYCFPRPEGFEHDLKFARLIRDRFPEIKIVGLAESVSPRIFLRTIPLGVDCILLNDASSELLRRAIEFVLLGQQIFPLGLVQAAVLAAVQESPQNEVSSPPEYPWPQRPERTRRRRAGTLSDRDHQIVSCLVQGLSNREAALQLNVTEGTVKARVQSLLRKAGVTNRTQAVMWALSGKSGEPGP